MVFQSYGLRTYSSSAPRRIRIQRNSETILRTDVHTAHCRASSPSQPISSAMIAPATAIGVPHKPSSAPAKAGVSVMTPRYCNTNAVKNPIAGAPARRIRTQATSSLHIPPMCEKSHCAPNVSRTRGVVIFAKFSYKSR